MRLIEMAMEKKLDLAQSFALRKWYKKEVWNHSIAYNYALFYLGLEDKDAKKKNQLWQAFLLSPRSIDSPKYLKLQKMISDHWQIINDAYSKMSQHKEENVYTENQIFKHTRTLAPFGVFAYEIIE